jgi:hypothetical protein
MVNLGGARPLNFFSVQFADRIIWTLVFKHNHRSYSVGMSNFVCLDVDRAISGKTETRLKTTIVYLVLNMVPVK